MSVPEKCDHIRPYLSIYSTAQDLVAKIIQKCLLLDQQCEFYDTALTRRNRKTLSLRMFSPVELL